MTSLKNILLGFLSIIIIGCSDNNQDGSQSVDTDVQSKLEKSQSPEDSVEPANENDSVVGTPKVEFPYLLVIKCGNQGADLFNCLTDGTVSTEIELRNGREYNMFTTDDFYRGNMNQYRRSDGRGGLVFEFLLRETFEFKIQNASSLVLNAKIFDSTSRDIVFEESTTQYGVIAVSQ